MKVQKNNKNEVHIFNRLLNVFHHFIFMNEYNVWIYYI